MGFEYRGVSTDGSTVRWSMVVAAIEGLDALQMRTRRETSATFDFCEVSRDRTSWPEDGFVSLEPDGTIYILCHVSPPPSVIEQLAQRMRELGAPVEIDEL